MGVLVSGVVGYLTIKYFLRFLAGHRLDRLRLLPTDSGGRDGGVVVAGLISWLRRSFITGFFVTVPLVISVAAFVWIFRLIDGFVGPFYAAWLKRGGAGTGYPHDRARGALVGAIATNVLGKRLLQRAESYLLRVPVFRTIYAPVKQLVVAFSPDNEYGFKHVVLVEDAARDFLLGFLTKEFTVDRGQGPESMVAVYVPTNHLYLGDVLICPRDKASFPDITVEQGIRLFLTGGMSLSSRVRARRGIDRVGDFRV